MFNALTSSYAREMIRYRNIVVQQFSCRSFFKSMNVTLSSSHTTVTSLASRLHVVLSRSRTPEQTVNFVSRLPASRICLFSSASGLKDDEIQRKVEDVSEKFKEAMELLDDAVSSCHASLSCNLY